MAIESALDALNASVLNNINTNQNLKSANALFSNVLSKNMIESGVFAQNAVSKSGIKEKNSSTDKNGVDNRKNYALKGEYNSEMAKLAANELISGMLTSFLRTDLETVILPDGRLNPLNNLYFHNIIYTASAPMFDFDIGELTNQVSMARIIHALMSTHIITATDISNFSLLNQSSCSSSCNCCNNLQCYMFVLYLIGMNILLKLQDKKDRKFNYPDEKKKKEMQLRKKDAEEKENMKNFAAHFQFG